MSSWVGSLSVPRRSARTSRSVSGRRPGGFPPRAAPPRRRRCPPSARRSRRAARGRTGAQDPLRAGRRARAGRSGELQRSRGPTAPLQRGQEGQERMRAGGARRCDRWRRGRSGRRAGCGRGIPAAPGSSGRPSGCPRHEGDRCQAASRSKNSSRCSNSRPCRRSGSFRRPASSRGGERGHEPRELGATAAQELVELRRREPVGEPAQRLDDRAERQSFAAQLDAAAASTRKPACRARAATSLGSASCRRPPRPPRGRPRAPISEARSEGCRHVVQFEPTAHERRARIRLAMPPFCRYTSSGRPACAAPRASHDRSTDRARRSLPSREAVNERVD